MSSSSSLHHNDPATLLSLDPAELVIRASHHEPTLLQVQHFADQLNRYISLLQQNNTNHASSTTVSVVSNPEDAEEAAYYPEARSLSTGSMSNRSTASTRYPSTRSTCTEHTLSDPSVEVVQDVDVEMVVVTGAGGTRIPKPLARVTQLPSATTTQKLPVQHDHHHHKKPKKREYHW